MRICIETHSGYPFTESCKYNEDNSLPYVTVMRFVFLYILSKIIATDIGIYLWYALKSNKSNENHAVRIDLSLTVDVRHAYNGFIQFYLLKVHFIKWTLIKSNRHWIETIIRLNFCFEMIGNFPLYFLSVQWFFHIAKIQSNCMEDKSQNEQKFSMLEHVDNKIVDVHKQTNVASSQIFSCWQLVIMFRLACVCVCWCVRHSDPALDVRANFSTLK